MDLSPVLFIAILVLSCKQVLSSSRHVLPNGGQIKAVLVAGSNGYDNYRHQADVCHAYQVLHENGIPDENIIVMMYDDIANSNENPDQGVIINRPGGPNVYKNVPKDYTGKDVNKENFFHILNGNKDAMAEIGTGRVLKSGPQDHVFINFVDHGGPGVLLMPEEEVYANEFINVLKNMSEHSRFDKMFLYIEACDSGSMFDNLLPDDLNIFVMTAADPRESSYACFYDDKLQTYLADVFSVKWMHNSETVDLQKESVNHQFQQIRTETNTSHVEEYGDIDIGITKLSEVIGFREKRAHYQLNINDAVVSHHVPVAILGIRIKAAKSLREKEGLQLKLHLLLEKRKEIEQVFMKLLETSLHSTNQNAPHPNEVFQVVLRKRTALNKSNVDCFESTVTHLSKECFSISKNPYAATHLHKVINLCNIVPEAVLKKKISALCNDKPKPCGIV